MIRKEIKIGKQNKNGSRHYICDIDLSHVWNIKWDFFIIASEDEWVFKKTKNIYPYE